MDKQETITASRLQQEARYLHISIPYDKDDELITFDDGMMTELECDEGFIPPMLNSETLRLEVTIDLKELKVIDWHSDEGYIRMWGKVRDSGTYTLLDSDKKPLWQIDGYVPNKLIPPYDGCGDYLELAIEEDGTLLHWDKDLDYADFAENGQEPQPIKTNKWHRAEDAYYDVMRHHLNVEEAAWLIGNLMAKYKVDMEQVSKVLKEYLDGERSSK